MANQKLALEWAQEMKEVDEEYRNEKDDAAADYILSQLQPTMADVEFVLSEHRFAGVTSVTGGNHILWDDGEDEYLRAIAPSGQSYRLRREDIVLNGKRYKIQEVGDAEDGATVSQHENVGGDQAEHPKFLRTIKGYAEAPAGTVVMKDGELPLVKTYDGVWKSTVLTYEGYEAAGVCRPVVRWGWSS